MKPEGRHTYTMSDEFFARLQEAIAKQDEVDIKYVWNYLSWRYRFVEGTNSAVDQQTFTAKPKPPAY